MKVVKKKLRLKKKNFSIFLLCLLTIIGTIILAINYKPPKVAKSIKRTVKDLKLTELGYVNKKINYFNYKYLDRYIAYKKKHTNLSNEKVVLNVNIGLDYNYYTHTKKTPYLNKSFILINKYYYAGNNYIPENLEEISNTYARSGTKLVSYAKEAFEAMAKEAKQNNLTIVGMSGYRSYNYQVNLYNKYVASDGKDAADSYSARPGYSEHQTGLAIDVYNNHEDYTNFANTKEYLWMQENAYKYGFILRFPKDKTDETGYVYESWHYRYVGKDIATYIYKHHLCFEEYYAEKIEKY